MTKTNYAKAGRRRWATSAKSPKIVGEVCKAYGVFNEREHRRVIFVTFAHGTRW